MRFKTFFAVGLALVVAVSLLGSAGAAGKVNAEQAQHGHKWNGFAVEAPFDPWLLIHYALFEDGYSLQRFVTIAYDGSVFSHEEAPGWGCVRSGTTTHSETYSCQPESSGGLSCRGVEVMASSPGSSTSTATCGHHVASCSTSFSGPGGSSCSDSEIGAAVSVPWVTCKGEHSFVRFATTCSVYVKR